MKTINPLTDTRVVSRFWEKVRKRGDCWQWVGHKNTMTGYGLFAVTRDDIREAYLVSYEMKYGPIPEPENPSLSTNINLTCKNRQCVNPDHVQIFFGGERERRKAEKLSSGQPHPNSNEARKAKTECLNGHPYTEENTQYNSKGHRRCRQCKRDQKRIATEARREIS